MAKLILTAATLVMVCTSSWGQVSETVVRGLMSCADTNFQKVHSGELSFSIKKHPTQQGRLVLPRVIQQLASQGLPSDLVNSYLAEDVTEGRFVFSGYKFRIDGSRKRVPQAGESAPSAGREGEQIALRYNGKHFAYLSEKGRAVIQNKPGLDIGDLRVPAILFFARFPRYTELPSEYLRRAQQEKRLQVIRVTGELGRRMFVVKITLPSPVASLPPMHEVLHFREDWGCMLVKRELYDTVPYAGRTVTWKRVETVVDGAQQVSGGGWFPTQVREVVWGGEIGAPLKYPLVPVAETVLEFRSSQFNRKLRNALFEADFPPGTVVENKVSHTFYVVRTPLGQVKTVGAVALVLLLVSFIAWRWWLMRQTQG
ncbi:MAG: hypothetical protein HPY54_17135 [Chthonomonadetes bacterium]|nr:hypothetical protein [Chthonomonadetes bacterium]